MLLKALEIGAVDAIGMGEAVSSLHALLGDVGEDNRPRGGVFGGWQAVLPIVDDESCNFFYRLGN